MAEVLRVMPTKRHATAGPTRRRTTYWRACIEIVPGGCLGQHGEQQDSQGKAAEKPCLVRMSGGRITSALLMSASMCGSFAGASAAARSLADASRRLVEGRTAFDDYGW